MRSSIPAQSRASPVRPATRNVSKAGVKVLTEALAHSLRNEAGTDRGAPADPGSTFTGMTSRGRAKAAVRKGAGSGGGLLTTACIVVTSYPVSDNDVTREIDSRRILCAHITEKRPALSRWHRLQRRSKLFCAVSMIDGPDCVAVQPNGPSRFAGIEVHRDAVDAIAEIGRRRSI